MVLPELRGLGGQRIHDDQELQVSQAGADFPLVRRGCQRVETLGDIAVDLALFHQLEDLQHVVRLVQLGQIVVAPVVVCLGGIAPP